MKKHYITILDSMDELVYQYEVYLSRDGNKVLPTKFLEDAIFSDESVISDTIEDFIEQCGHNTNNSQWMVHSDNTLICDY